MKNMIGNNIKLLRESRKWSQKELGDQLKVKSQTVSSWETGRTEPDIKKLEEIADLFNVSARDIIWATSIDELHALPEHVTIETPAMDRLITALENMPEPITSTFTKEEQELLDLWHNATLTQKMQVYNILSNKEQ